MTLRTTRRGPRGTDAPVEPEDGDRHRLTVVGGLAALSLDAMASVAYGPEAIVLVLALAGGAGLGFTLPVTLVITGLLLVLTLSHRHVIAAFPEGGGAYGVAKKHLGRRASLVAAASLVVDYILNVAVSVAADGDMNVLVPLFAIGVFVGFTLSQAGMVRHWWTLRPVGWRRILALNGFGALLTGIAAIVVTASKFTEGAWLIALVIPALVWLFGCTHRLCARRVASSTG